MKKTLSGTLASKQSAIILFLLFGFSPANTLLEKQVTYPNSQGGYHNIFTYNTEQPDSNLTRLTSRAISDTSQYFVTEHAYDSKGRIASTAVKGAEGTTFHYTLFDYNEKDLLISEMQFHGDSSLQYIDSLSYGNNNKIKRRNRFVNNNLNHYIEFSYFNNLPFLELHFEKDSSSFKETRAIVYRYENSRLIKKEENVVKNQKAHPYIYTNYTYHNGKLSIKTRHKEGYNFRQLIDSTTYTTDRTGTILEAKNFDESNSLLFIEKYTWNQTTPLLPKLTGPLVKKFSYLNGEIMITLMDNVIGYLTLVNTKGQIVQTSSIKNHHIQILNFAPGYYIALLRVNGKTKSIQIPLF